jgi:hypothetical protein
MLISDIVVDRPLASLLARRVRVAPSIAMGRTEAYYLDALKNAGLVGSVIDNGE